MKSPLSWLPIASGMLVLVLSLGLAFVTVSGRNGGVGTGAGQNLTSNAANVVPTISLSPATGDYSFSAGQTYPVGIVVDSAGKSIDGVDVVISYDSAKVQVVGGKVNPTSLFSENPLNSAAQGKIRFSVLSFSPQPQSGIIGTFSIKPLVKGEVDLNVDYAPGSTTDSNIAEHGSAMDVLGGVVSAKYTFN